MIGAAKLDVDTFEEVEADTSATKQAMLVVVIVAVATGIGLVATGGLSGVILGIVVGLGGWAAWAWITFYIGTKLLPTADTQADWGQLARTLGFAQSPGVFKVVGLVPGVGLVIFALAAIWQLVAMIIAIRQALDYTSTWRAIGVALIGFIPYAIVQTLLQVIYRF
ncbi:MAG: YIP1 family protein [Chloroflexi bacterium]|nr:YIP1 family protein [Chloroflexota bacterium]